MANLTKSTHLSAIVLCFIVTSAQCDTSLDTKLLRSKISTVDDGGANATNLIVSRPSKSMPPSQFIKNLNEIDEYIYKQQFVEYSYDYFYGFNQTQKQRSIAEFGQLGMFAKLHTIVYNDFFSHRYDNFKELKLAGGPQIDQEVCLKQLAHLVKRSEAQVKEKYDSKDINLFRLLDSFGRVPPGLSNGNAFWIGSYSECLATEIELPEANSKTRYCIASVKQNSWPDNPLTELALLKSAVCLPKACDSLNYKNKFDLIYKLMESQFREMDKDQAQLTNLYCLPDEESTLRVWWQSPRVVFTVIGFSIWFAILLYSTIKYEQLREGKAEEESCRKSEFGLTNGFKLDETPEKRSEVDPYMSIYSSLSVINNFELLFNTSKKSALLETARKLKQQSSDDNLAQNSETLVVEERKFVDLSILEGIKVICMMYVILGHVLMCFSLVINNGRELASTTSVAFFISNLVPAFAVNSFFTITGLLTSFLLFKQNQSYSFMSNPGKWVAFIMYRYLRIMPMYMIVVLYTKTISKYTGSGPYWDYGTSSLGHRRSCEEESWFWTILFGANFKSPLNHCVATAWYLANDFQFFLVTPIFLSALNKNPKFGKKLLKFAIAAGYVAGFYSIFVTELEDLRPVARFMPQGFKTYVTNLNNNYTRPQYRIPAYLIGLLIGFNLYTYEQKKMKFFADKKKNASQTLDSLPKDSQLEGSSSKAKETESNDVQVTEEPDWPENFKKYGLTWSIFFVTVCIATPAISAMIPFSKLSARIILAIIMPSYHVLFSLSVGIYIILATTGSGYKLINKCLSASFWKPLSRLSLCAVLVNVEVIIYLAQSNTHAQYLDNKYHLAMNILSIFLTYIVAIAVCVLFEAPMRAALNHLLKYAFSKVTTRSSKQKTS